MNRALARGRRLGTAGTSRPSLSGGLLGILLAVGVLAGCQAQIDAAGEPGDTQVLVSRSRTALTVTAPEWRPPQTLVYLCPVAPVKTVAGLVDAGSITLSPDCVTYGLIDTSGGLATELGYGTIDAARRPTFESAPDWHLVLIGIRDGAADRVFRTAISAVPIDPSITPGPDQPVPSAPAPASPRPSPSSSVRSGPGPAPAGRAVGVPA